MCQALKISQQLLLTPLFIPEGDIEWYSNFENLFTIQISCPVSMPPVTKSSYLIRQHLLLKHHWSAGSSFYYPWNPALINVSPLVLIQPFSSSKEKSSYFSNILNTWRCHYVPSHPLPGLPALTGRAFPLHTMGFTEDTHAPLETDLQTRTPDSK